MNYKNKDTGKVKDQMQAASYILVTPALNQHK